MTLKEIPKILGSLRFWFLVVFAILRVLQQEEVITEGFVNSLASIVEIVVGGGIVVRTVDKFRK